MVFKDIKDMVGVLVLVTAVPLLLGAMGGLKGLFGGDRQPIQTGITDAQLDKVLSSGGSITTGGEISTGLPKPPSPWSFIFPPLGLLDMGQEQKVTIPTTTITGNNNQAKGKQVKNIYRTPKQTQKILIAQSPFSLIPDNMKAKLKIFGGTPDKPKTAVQNQIQERLKILNIGK